MKITICGSMSFAKQMKEVKSELEKLRHEASVPDDTELHISNPTFIDNLEEDLKHCLEKDLMRDHMNRVAESEAILVLNYPKNSLKSYIGTSTMMEMGIAYYLKKKMFLLNPPPQLHEVRWAIEVAIMQPTIINGDLTLIK